MTLAEVSGGDDRSRTRPRRRSAFSELMPTRPFENYRQHGPRVSGSVWFHHSQQDPPRGWTVYWLWGSLWEEGWKRHGSALALSSLPAERPALAIPGRGESPLTTAVGRPQTPPPARQSDRFSRAWGQEEGARFPDPWPVSLGTKRRTLPR